MEENESVKELYECVEKINTMGTDLNKWAKTVEMPETVRDRLSWKIADIWGVVDNTVSKLRFHLKAAKIKECIHAKTEPFTAEEYFGRGRTGDLVQIKPCGEEYKGKTYLGIFLGMAALSTHIEIKEDKFECKLSSYNPAILVPELKKIIYGCESWWGKINTVEELKQITKEDIESVWYVKLLNQFNKEV